jgi:hypothetical protein
MKTEREKRFYRDLLVTVCPTCGSVGKFSLEISKREILSKDGFYRNYETCGPAKITCCNCGRSVSMDWGILGTFTQANAFERAFCYFKKRVIPSPSKRTKAFVSFNKGKVK